MVSVTSSLTTGIDTVTSGYSVVNAVIDQTTTGTNTTTLNVSDSVTAAANATVNLTLLSNSTTASTNGSNTAGMGSTGATTLNVKVVDGANAAINFAALNVSGFTGLTTLNVANSSVSGGTVNLVDVATFTGLASTTNVSLNTNGQFQGVALTGADWTGAADKLTLSVTGRNGSLAATTGNESIAVTSASADARLASLITVSATSATVAGLGLKIDASMDSTLKTFDASTSTGPVNVYLIPGTVLTSAKGGTGTADVLAVNALSTTQVVSGFEKIIAEQNGTYVLTNVTGATSLGVDATVGGTVAATFTAAAATTNSISVSGGAQRTTAANTTNNLSAGIISYALATATGTTDALTLAIDNGGIASSSTTAGTLTLGGLTTTAIETVTITAADFKTITILGSVTLGTATAGSTVSVTATGASNINFGTIDISSANTFTTTSAINLGGMTGRATLTIIGTGGLIYTGSAGIDTLTNAAVAAAKTQTYNLGDGTDAFTLLNTAADDSVLVVNGEAGDDIFNAAVYSRISTSSLIDGGAGTDTLNIVTAVDMTGLKNIANVEKIVAQAAGIVDGGALSGDTIEVTNFGGGANRLNVTADGAGATVNLTNFTFVGANTGVIVNGGAGVDTITGTLGDDAITGLGGADSITGGLGADIITGGAGNDAINLTETTASIDKVVFSGGTVASASASAPTAHLTANGYDTITGFTSIDTLNIVGLTGAIATISTNNVVTTAAAAGAVDALTTNQTYIISATGLAASIKTGGTATVTDWTNLTQVGAYLSERYSVTNSAQYNDFIINVTSGNNDTSYVYAMSNVAANATIDVGDLVLVGVITHTAGTIIATGNVVYA